MDSFQPIAGVLVDFLARAPPDSFVSRTDVTHVPGRIVGRILAHEKHRSDVFTELAETFFALAKGQICPFARPADLGLAQFALHGRKEAGEFALHQVIVSAGLHGGYGHIFADLAGHEQEWNVESMFLHDAQGIQAAKSGHRVVGNYNVPGMVLESGFEALG
jgi:hypothetical protein